MDRIIIVEEDPIVWLDLSDLLQRRFPQARLERVALPEALALIAADGQPATALITASLPEDPAALCPTLGLLNRVVVTNSVNDNLKKALPKVAFFERPFDLTAILDVLLGEGTFSV